MGFWGFGEQSLGIEPNLLRCALQLGCNVLQSRSREIQSV